jgi:hypothetical protein
MLVRTEMRATAFEKNSWSAEKTEPTTRYIAIIV